MNFTDLAELDKILLNVLPLNKKIRKQHVTRLTAAGDNYGSLMLAIKVDLENEDTQEHEDLYVVAKTPPPNEFIQQVFNTKVTFKLEIEFYKSVLPELKNYQKKHNVENVLECFPKFYGSRLSLNSSSAEIDNDAVLLLENLKILNFDTGDRIVGFGLEEARLIIKNLARFQSVLVAIRKQDPKIFEEKFKPILPEYKLFADEEKMKKQVWEQVAEIVEESETVSKHLEVVKDIFIRVSNTFMDRVKNAPKNFKGKYISICHCDLWVNNIMIKYVEDQVREVKFVDLQIYEIGSLVVDLLFFIFTSVQSSIIENNFDELISLYYNTFIESLKALHCDIFEYSLENFKEEVETVLMGSELYHIIFMLTPILAPKGTVKEIDELSQEEFDKKKEIPKEEKDRLVFIIDFLDKRGWLK